MFTRLTRRRMLQLSGSVLGAAGLAGVGRTGSARAANAVGIDFSQRASFDTAYQAFAASPAGAPDLTNEAGGLAWGLSYSLLSLVRMYEAYRDPVYLDLFVESADAVLSTRDSERHVTDYRGLSLPAWRAGDAYTSGLVRLNDAAGRPTLEIRTAAAHGGSAIATVSSDGDTFSVTVTNSSSGLTHTYSGLTMDPASPGYAVQQIYDAYEGTFRVTARDLRREPSAAGDPAPGQFDFAPQYVIFAVHTGMITYPMAYFAELVMSDPGLYPKYREKAQQYVAAVRAAVAVHDREWREDVVNGERLGSYAWLKGMPLPWDGCQQPLNQSLGLGQAIAVLARITGDPAYQRKAELLAATMRSQLVTDATGSDVWTYWPSTSPLYTGYARTGSPDTDISSFTPEYPGGNKAIDDVSHGAITVECAVQFGRSGYVGDSDLDRMARTYSQHLAQTGADGIPTTATRMDGTGVATSGYYLQAPRWMPLASRDAVIYPQSLSIYAARQPAINSGSLVLGVAYFNWFAQTHH